MRAGVASGTALGAMRPMGDELYIFVTTNGLLVQRFHRYAECGSLKNKKVMQLIVCKHCADMKRKA